MKTSFLADMHTDGFCPRKSKTIVSCSLLKFVQTKLQLTLDYTHTGLFKVCNKTDIRLKILITAILPRRVAFAKPWNELSIVDSVVR